MARPIRVQFEGAVYHITARGNERRRVYRDDEDRKAFLVTLAETVKQHGLRVHCYCLMPNHYHLLVETPRGNLSRAIGWLQTTYTIRFNRRHRRSGHLFQGRFKAHLVEADSYAMALLRYVHLNPVRPKNKSTPVPDERRAELEKYLWSSHRFYAGHSSAPEWLCVDWLSFFGKGRRSAEKEYERFMGDAFGEVIMNPWDELRAGLVLGGDALFERVRGMLSSKASLEELVWVSRVEDPEIRKSVANQLVENQSDRRWKVWIRVCLGNERRIDVARSLDYADGSAITQILKRLERQLSSDPASAKQMTELKREFNIRLSGVKS